MIVCGWWLSSKVKSLGPRPGIAFPELSVTTTSRLMRPCTASDASEIGCAGTRPGSATASPVCGGGPAPEAVFAQRDPARQRTNAGKKRLGSDGPNDSCLNRIICRIEVIAASSDTQILITLRLNLPSILRWSVMPVGGLAALREFKSGQLMINPVASKELPPVESDRYAALSSTGTSSKPSCLACRLSFASNLFSLWASLASQMVSSYSTWFLIMV